MFFQLQESKAEDKFDFADMVLILTLLAFATLLNYCEWQSTIH